MNDQNISEPDEIARIILAQARALGASLAGIASVERLKTAPSFTMGPKMPPVGDGIGTRAARLPGTIQGEATWPENARSVLVIALSHPEDQPDMDWWFGPKMPTGNRKLLNIINEMGPWIEDQFQIETVHLPYHVEKGGTYLKDAGVMAGLGCVGKNNLLVTPQFGPRVRLRAMLLSQVLPPTGPIDFDPCVGCGEFCRIHCPQSNFETLYLRAEEYGQEILPGRDGRFSRPGCTVQMAKDEEGDPPLIKYCRACELSCPVGKVEEVG